MEGWRKVWREGFAPLLPTPGLEALRRALADDDPRLIQGATVNPPPLQCVQDWPVEGADAIAFCGWRDGDELGTVAETEEFFARICFQCDQALKEPAGCRWFLNWYDETPRDEMRRELLAEVNRTLGAARRERLGLSADAPDYMCFDREQELMP